MVATGTDRLDRQRWQSMMSSQVRTSSSPHGMQDESRLSPMIGTSRSTAASRVFGRGVGGVAEELGRFSRPLQPCRARRAPEMRARTDAVALAQEDFVLKVQIAELE